METENIVDKLADLTADLSSTPENEKYLDSIRRVLGYNLRKKRQNISAVKPQAAELKLSLPNERVQEFNKYVVASLPKEDKYLVQRSKGKDIVPVVGVQLGNIRLPINPLEASDEIRWNQKRGDQIGPFLSAEGRSLWFDLYYYEDKLTVRSQTGNIPYFLFSKAQKNIWFDTFKKIPTVSLKAGHVWLLGKLFTTAAGNNEYVGFNIKSGTFSLSNKKKWSGQFLDFEGDFSGKLALELVQPEKNNPSFAGCTAAQNIDFNYPDQITLEWTNGNLTSIVSDDGKFTGYGNDLVFSNFKLPASYQNELNHIFIPCKATPTTWKTDFSPSRIFAAQGNAEIKKSFWALPIVKVSNPTTLGEPENNGGWGMRLSSDITAKWVGLDQQQPEARLNDSLLLLYPQALFLFSQKTAIDLGSTNKIQQNFSCWQLSAENTARIPLSLSYQADFPLIYYCHANDGEALLAGCGGQIQPDRPLFAEGSHVTMKDMQGWVVFHSKGTTIKINVLLGNLNALKDPVKPLVLENALLMVSQPLGFILEGTLSVANNNNLEQGQITLTHGLLRWQPILPDPYVSNLQEGRESVGSARSFSAILFAQISWAQPDKPVVTFKGDLPLASGVDIKPASDPVIQALPVQLDGQTLEEIKGHQINSQQRANKDNVDGTFDQLEKRLAGWRLLDVSTNMDLIGVSVSPFLFGGRDKASFASRAATTNTGQAVNNAFVIKEMAVNTPLSVVHVFTVPQVQWEPVRTLPEDQNMETLGWFPEYLASATDGGPTRLLGINQELSPIIPDVVVRNIQKSFTQGSPAAALTTLAFGLKAVVQLTPQNTATRNADSLAIFQPDFSQKKMKGGIQINMLAESGNHRAANRSPGFEGYMAQTLNGYELFTGTELGLSVLGATVQPDASVETQFNKEFFSGGTDPFVPVTRFDISGYGGSNFSEWDNPGALAQIGKVQFKIMVGRTAFEVVKFVSKIYPWGMTVTRSVTIERRGGGGVIRKDSGWQATQAGIFDFSTDKLPQPYTFRPGTFRGCFNTKNIRPASNDIIKFIDPSPLPDPLPDLNPATIENSVELAPVYFDADVQLDGQNGSVFAKGILGFIQLSPKGKTLSAAALRKLITDQGAVGGPIDTTLNIGNSGFKFRATRFEVDVTDNGGTANFICVVRGQPALPSNGSWSVIKMAAPGNTTDPQEAVSADVSRGTPLFIENTWQVPVNNTMNVSGPAGPYRFADPTDLFVAQPRYDYGFMQNTGSQAFLFRRPVIVSGTNEISSNLKPAFADPFALFTTKGVFPPISNVIEFPNANYKLRIQSSTGKLQLNTPVNLTNPRTPLLIAQDGTNQVAIEYDQSRLKYNLNYDDWTAELDTFFVWTSLAGISKLFGSRFSLQAGTTRQSKLVNVVSLMNPDIRDALSFMPGMGQDQSVKDIDLGMTNAGHEIKIVAGYSCGIEIDIISGDVEIKCLPKLPGDPEPFENKKSISLEIEGGLETGLGIDLVGGSTSFVLDVSLGAALQGKIPISGIFFLVLGLEVEVGWSILPESSSSLEIAAYVGVGIGGSIGPFTAQGFVAVGLVFIYEDDTAKFGGLVKLEAEVDLVIVSVGLAAELKGVYYKGDDPDTAATETDVSLIDASGEVAVNVSIFLVFSITASYEYQTTIKP